MKNKELIARLRQMDPEAEVITSFWNGHVDSYCIVDRVREWRYEDLEGDFFGTPSAADPGVFCSQAEKVVFLGPGFPATGERVSQARGTALRLLGIWEEDKPEEWKREKTRHELQLLREDARRDWFDEDFVK